MTQHIKKVAKEDVRLFIAPFVGAVKAIKDELQRSQHKGTMTVRGKESK